MSDFEVRIENKINDRFEAICARFDKRTDEMFFKFDEKLERHSKEHDSKLERHSKEHDRKLELIRKESREDRRAFRSDIKWTFGLGFTLFGVLIGALNIYLKFM